MGEASPREARLAPGERAGQVARRRSLPARGGAHDKMSDTARPSREKTNSGPPRSWEARCSCPGRKGVSGRGDYLPARYEVHMLFMRVFCPALNVFMQES
jgi:hypothetical protein